MERLTNFFPPLISLFFYEKNNELPNFEYKVFLMCLKIKFSYL